MNREAILPQILSSVCISHVYQALTGKEPRGHDAVRRAPAPWRNTSDLNLSLHDGKGTWYDFTSGEGGGMLDLVARIRGGGRESALRWLAEYSGVPLADQPLSQAERTRWAAECRELERYLPTARYWQTAAIELGEEILAELKCGLFDPTAMQPDVGEIAEWTARLAWWRRMGGAELVEEYLRWMQHDRQLTAGMVHQARNRERAEVRALLEYFAESKEHPV